jgi:F-type H+/Na+-transporting ATPase subunit alpha
VAKSLRIDLAQFRELAAFSQFSTDLDPETRQRIERGQRLTELLKQPQYSPMAVWQMYAVLLAATEGVFDKVPLDKVKTAEANLLRELKDDKELIEAINSGAEPDDKMKKSILDTAKKVVASYHAVEEKKAKD